MSFNIIQPEQYQTILWKNNKGKTIELALNEGGTTDDFDWRISSATVTEEGVFSDFSGSERNMVLIEGSGLTLKHDNGQIDHLTNPLDIANFDGGWRTTSQLDNGTIKNINLMTNKNKFSVDVSTFVECQRQKIMPADLVFIISLADNTKLNIDGNSIVLGKFCLAKLISEVDDIIISGQQVIVFRLLFVMQ